MHSEGPYSTAIAYLLWFLSGFGVLGFHRFYLGKIGSGILWILTGGLAFIGSVYDFFTLPGQVREANMRESYRISLADAYCAGTVAGQERAALDALKAMKREAGAGESIERVILRTAKKNRGIATASEVALEGNIPIETAKQCLEKLALDGHAEMKVTKEGVIVYLFHEFRATAGSEPEFEDFNG